MSLFKSDELRSILHRAAQGENFCHTISVGTGAAVFSVWQDGEPDILSQEQKLAYTVQLGEASQMKIQRFIRGRTALQRAIDSCGTLNSQEQAFIGVGDWGEPVLPSGLSGSLSHCRSCSIGVISSHSKLSPLGIDLERITTEVDVQSINVVLLSPSERFWIEAQEDKIRNTFMLFSAKESALKALTPILKRPLSLDALQLERAEGGTFWLRYEQNVSRAVVVLSEGDWVLSLSSGLIE